MRELARLRNEAARSVGYRDWFALSLATDEMDENKLDTLAAADRVTAEPFARWKSALDAARGALSLRRLRLVPGTTRIRSSRSRLPRAPSISTRSSRARTWWRSRGDLRGRRIRGRGYSTAATCTRGRKNQHAFCIDIDRSGDVRILANVIDNHSWTDTMLHELGHGAYDLGFDDDLRWLLRDTHLVTTEASALLFGALAGDREWLEQVLDVSPDEANELEGRLRAARAAELRLHPLGSRHERVRASPLRRPGARSGCRLVGARRAASAGHASARTQSTDWAAKIHIAVAPVYYHMHSTARSSHCR